MKNIWLLFYCLHIAAIMLSLSWLRLTLNFLCFCRSSPSGTTTTPINTQRELLLSQLKEMETKADIINTDLAQVGIDNC